MSFLDRILNRKQKTELPPEPPKLEIPPKHEIPVETPKPIASEPPKSSLDLTKKIGLTFEKLNLDKADVRSKKVFALDTSGSMDETFGEGKNRKRKIDSLIEVMEKYPDANMVVFPAVKKIDDASRIPEPNGGTPLDSALRFISKMEPKPEGVVLVSDGLPDDEHDALAEAQKLALPIDIIYIGDKNSKGERFMEKLAKQTGGQHFTV